MDSYSKEGQYVHLQQCMRQMDSRKYGTPKSIHFHVEPRIVRYDTLHAWSSRCVQLHRIKPSDVRFSPGLKETLEMFYNWALLHYTLKEVRFVAHGCAFNRFRLQEITNELVPSVVTASTRFEWTDRIPLLKPIVCFFLHSLLVIFCEYLWTFSLGVNKFMYQQVYICVLNRFANLKKSLGCGRAVRNFILKRTIHYCFTIFL